MFRKSNKHHQLDAFSAASNLLQGKTLDFYQNPLAWHNLFRKEILMRLNEGLFSELFCADNGAPNASIRVLLSMMILKEGHGWSDSELFENCRYNMLIRSSLGLMNMEDVVPTESTYYLFRKRIVDHEKSKGENLFEKAFAQITKTQMIDFHVSGKKIRMDSKLLGSNIAWLSRYELIHDTLAIFVRNSRLQINEGDFTSAEFALMEALLKETGNKVVYRSTQDEITDRITSLGLLIYKLLKMFEAFQGKEYQMLERVFNEQFTVDEETKEVIALEKEKISAKSLQSPHDEECTYRNKDGNKVKGYSVNVTETCDTEQGNLNLIVDVAVDTVSTPDTEFLKPGIEGAQEVVTGQIEKAIADGAYNSQENQAFCQNEAIELVVQAIQGAESRHNLSIDEQTGELRVEDNVTGEVIPATKIVCKKDSGIDKWRIKTSNSKYKYRYFTMKDVIASQLRQKVRQTPRDELNIRNNVEATIFQVGYHYPNDKSRYRGLCKHKMWASVRSLWVNFRRIEKHTVKMGLTTCFFAESWVKNRLDKFKLILFGFFSRVATYFLPTQFWGQTTRTF
jgi:hypothetical protein